MAQIDIENRLKQKAKRAQVAFAARCARRVQPLVMRLTSDPQQRGAVDRAISLAEQVAQGNPVTLQAGEVADAAREVAQAAWSAKDTAATSAVEAATYAAKAAGAVRSRNAYLVASPAFYAYNDAAGAARIAGAQDAFESACLKDLDKLERLKLGLASRVGAPIDPSERGPLGPLWPEGEPEWKC